MSERDEHASAPGLSGLEVALTGRLASMPRDEARARIDEGGGRFVPAPTEETALLVVGQGGPPLGDDGRLTRSLRAARAMQERGHPIRIVSEEEFLARLGLEERQDDLHRLYTTDQLARILGIRPSLVRYWVRSGLIKPVREVRRLHFFDFQQVAAARALHQLTQDGVSAARIRRSLQQLAGWQPRAEQVLAQLETLEGDGPLLLRTEDGALAEPSGQLRLEFPSTEPRLVETPPVPSLRPVPAPQSAEDWFELGVLAESEGYLDGAEDAYRRALDLGDDRPETWFNLGNTLYSLKRRRESADCYERACELAPDYVESWNNLGNVLGEMGEVDESIRAYRHALMVSEDYLDARYNLAETLANHGRLEEAVEHWHEYLELDGTSAFARMVRERMARAEAARRR